MLGQARGKGGHVVPVVERDAPAAALLHLDEVSLRQVREGPLDANDRVGFPGFVPQARLGDCLRDRREGERFFLHPEHEHDLHLELGESLESVAEALADGERR